jgi:hypothetical protein
MIQIHTCVRIRCDQCGDPLGGLGSEEYYPTETTALSAAEAVGWRLGPGGRLWCSACAPVLSCEAEGHQFTDWRHPRTEGGGCSAPLSTGTAAAAACTNPAPPYPCWRMWPRSGRWRDD